MKKIICAALATLTLCVAAGGCAKSTQQIKDDGTTDTKAALAADTTSTKTENKFNVAKLASDIAKNQKEELPQVTLDKPVDFYGITFDVSPAWRQLRVNSANMMEYGVLPNDPSSILSVSKGSVNAYASKTDTQGKSDSDLLYMVISNLLNTKSITNNISIAADTIDGKNFIKGIDYARSGIIRFLIYITGSSLYTFNLETSNKDTAYMNGLIEGVAASVQPNGKTSEQSNNNESTTVQKPVAQMSAEIPKFTEQREKTRWEKAIDKAKEYLNDGVYAKMDLKKALQKAGFTSIEAAFAVESAGIDWGEQALKKANQYLASMRLSKAGLMRALTNNGFSVNDAAYAIANCDANLTGWA